MNQDIRDLDRPPGSVIMHRDGRTYPSEIEGFRAAMHELVQRGLLAPTATFGIVDIRKSMADHLRLFEGPNAARLTNPTVGSYLVIRPNEGVVCTTGRPFSFPGTTKPLSLEITDGNLDIRWVLEDVFAMSQLVFTAPERCMRLPATIKFADDFLEAIASSVDLEEALYDEEQETLDAEEADADVTETAVS